MLRIAFALCQCLERLAFLHDHELPMLAITGAPGPTRYIEQCIDHVLWNGLLAELAHRAQSTQQLDTCLWGLFLCHRGSPFFLDSFARCISEWWIWRSVIPAWP